MVHQGERVNLTVNGNNNILYYINKKKMENNIPSFHLLSNIIYNIIYNNNLTSVFIIEEDRVFKMLLVQLYMSVNLLYYY